MHRRCSPGRRNKPQQRVAVGPLPVCRSTVTFAGGGFGAQYGIGNFGLLAVNLSRKAGAPVGLMLDRREEHVSVGNRPGSIPRLKIGAKHDGTLTAIQLESYGSGGVAAGAGVG